MKNVFNKANAPYLVSGALAIGTLLASGIFAVAPYVGFLAPVAALSLGLPFIIGGAVFSVAAIALSAVAISKNSTIAEKEAGIFAAVKENSKLREQLVERNEELKDKDTVISYLDANSVKKDTEMKKQLDKKVRYIINSDEGAQRVHQERKESKKRF
ncbi:hypothetical protein [Candidatus Wolbachia massiliensis]|uniref:Uncharacterized protein n=1 Tax=Candidatus Wolbachia massiliensis TaxID=1845000 RepID=A0A7L7YRV7_9RICK|nr:hypothetical protein [Candidatus Wolbachia massiliensis]QOD38041.1 hypothetical protein ID128_04375 [Candidatus Wolbachia massiliensis]